MPCNAAYSLEFRGIPWWRSPRSEDALSREDRERIESGSLTPFRRIQPHGLENERL